MVHATAPLLGGLLLGLWLSLAVSESTLCRSLKTLKNNLDPIKRRHKMKHNFPINYTISVHYEEVYRLNNISRLRSGVEGLKDWDLQELWFMVSQEVLKKIQNVLPDRHPSRNYVNELDTLFRKIEPVFQETQEEEEDERDMPERIQEIMDRVKDWESRGRRHVTPKFLMDNCYQTMHCLFGYCFSEGVNEHKYCEIGHWRNGKKKPQHPT